MTDPPATRSIRVFVSSTFRDMHAEREELVKQVFPAIRRLCEQRGVAWSEVDLRWGVTDEQKAEGAVLPICLAEIDRSRPYFIGLVGQRYGWVPEELPAGLVEQLPWLDGLEGTSVTELEVLHGVLNGVRGDAPTEPPQAFFYLRDPEWLMTRSAEERALLADDPGTEPAARLEQLRRAIRESGVPWWEYPDPRALGERVLADLTALVERLFPAEGMPDDAGRDAAAHEAYGAAQVQGHVERPLLSAALDRFMEVGGPPLVVTGPIGSGGPAGVTSWVRARRAAHPEEIVIEHHVAATADASDWRQMAARFVAALGAAAGFALDPPADAPGLRAALAAALRSATDRGRRVLVLVDGAELLDDIDGAPDLTWLPAAGSERARIVVTSSASGGDRPAAEARRRGWPVHEVPGLDAQERRALVSAFLGRYAKGLDEVHLARLVGSPMTGNVLFLRTLLDELRQHGEHFTIGAVLDRYLAAGSVEELLALVLARYETDFERDRPGLVRDSMRAVWAARRGITEPELLDVLGGVADGGEPLIGAVWSPLVLAAEAGLVTRSGLLAFATDAHRRAVEQRYLPDEVARQSAHAALARTFATYELSPRVVDELPWQQHAAGDHRGMFATLSDPLFTEAAYAHSASDLRRLWSRAEEAGHRIVDGYRSVVDDPSSDPEAAWAVARLVTDAGYPAEAVRLNRFLVDHYSSPVTALTPERSAARHRAALVNLGAALFGQGELAGAASALEEAVGLARHAGDAAVLRAALGNLGLCRRDRGDLDGAVECFEQEEALCRDTGDLIGLQASLGNHAEVFRRRGQPDRALAVMHEQETICRSIGDGLGVARALAAQAAVLGDRGDLAGALARYQAYGAASREMGDLRGAAEAMLSEVGTLRQLGDRATAKARGRQVEELTRRLDDEPLLARALDAQARLAADEGRWADAARLATEALLTARSAGAAAAVVMTLGILGIARRELGDVAGAREAHLEQERLAAADPAALATARTNLAACEIADDRLDGALAYYAQAEPVLRSLQLHMVLLPLLDNRARIHLHRGDAAAALADLLSGAESAEATGAHGQQVGMLTTAVELMYGAGRQAETEELWSRLAAACRTSGDDVGLQRALGEKALLLIARGDLDGAWALLDEQERICRLLGDQAGLAACLGNRAIVLRYRNDLAGSLGFVDEQLRIATATSNAQGILFATANRGEVLGLLGRKEEGLAALDEARRMAAGWGLTPMVAQLDQMIAALRTR